MLELLVFKEFSYDTKRLRLLCQTPVLLLEFDPTYPVNGNGWESVWLRTVRRDIPCLPATVHTVGGPRRVCLGEAPVTTIIRNINKSFTIQQQQQYSPRYILIFTLLLLPC